MKTTPDFYTETLVLPIQKMFATAPFVRFKDAQNVFLLLKLCLRKSFKIGSLLRQKSLHSKLVLWFSTLKEGHQKTWT